MTDSHPLLTRREAMGGIGTALAVPFVKRGRFAVSAQWGQEYSARAIGLIEQAPVFDMLGLLNLNFTQFSQWMADPEAFAPAERDRFVESGINVMHPAVGIGGANAFESVLQFLGAWNGFIASHPRWFFRVDSTSDLDQVNRDDRTGVILGVQNSDHFRTPDDVALFHGLGQRVSQLTYNSRNLIGSGSTERRDGGLSDFGVAVVERMNEVGMAVDVSHCGDQTTLDAFAASRKPVLITHSNCRALVPGHPRCKTDEAIVRMAESGGVMGITGVRMFVKNEEPTSIDDVLDHFDHVARLVGVEHLGVGSDIDLDGYDAMPAELNERLRAGYKDSYGFRDRIDIAGLDHPKRMFDLTEGLIRRGYGDEAIIGILGGNFRRVLADIW